MTLKPYRKRRLTNLFTVVDGVDIAQPYAAATQQDDVWHYTDAAGFIGMVSSGELWASSVVALNDSSEIEYGMQVIAEAAQRRKSADSSREIIDIVDALDSRDAIVQDVHVISASRESDLLNQWQGYAGRQGYAIRLDTAGHLIYRSNGEPFADEYDRPFTDSLAWRDVIYQRREQDALAAELLDFMTAIWAIYEDADKRFRSHAMRAAATSIAAHFKDKAFAPEAETRLVINRDTLVRERFRAGPRGIVPYLGLTSAPADKLRAEHLASPAALLPILEVKCGPSDVGERELLGLTALRMLTVHGYNVNVSHSAVPYRF